jgi:hypothetical protein
MHDSHTDRRRFWTFIAITAIGACHPQSQVTVTSPAPTVCYLLHFAPWKAPDSSRFANAPVGLVAPLPDTIALTSIPAATHASLQQYRVSRLPETAGQAEATWRPGGGDSLILRFPEAAGHGLIVQLRRMGQKVEGQAWIYLDERPSDLIRLTPWTNAVGTQLDCPASAIRATPGA